MMITENKFYQEESVFLPQNLLREARRQKEISDCRIPSICVLDPDGDLVQYLLRSGQATLNECWACYHSRLYTFNLNGTEIGILPCIVGASYAVLVAEQLFVSGCKRLVSITSAGIINEPDNQKRFMLITSAIRDEGTSYHYLPAERPAVLNRQLLDWLSAARNTDTCPYFGGQSWTTDAPYRETPSAIQAMKHRGITCVEMEAAALYALAEAKNYDIVCFAHITNAMAQSAGDFEKGEEFGSLDTLALLREVINKLKVK